MKPPNNKSPQDCEHARKSDDALVKNSALYKEFLAQREAILDHKWAKTQQSGEEVGFETALFDWMLHHRRKWKSKRESAPSSR